LFREGEEAAVTASETRSRQAKIAPAAAERVFEETTAEAAASIESAAVVTFCMRALAVSNERGQG